MVKPTSPPSCPPRWATERSPERETLGPAVGAAARAIGQPLMPWQQLVADVGCELTEDGIPAYREIVVAVPRQSGKTTLVLAFEIQRAVGWAQRLGKPQNIVYTAQTGLDAKQKLVDDQFPVLEAHKSKLGIARFMRAAGNESVRWGNGSRLSIQASTEEAGHGKTRDLAVKDEYFADTDYRRDQALIPAMATREHAQIVTASTAGTADSVPWNATVAAGRAAVEAGKRSGIAFFEWSAPVDADPADPAVWWACMPALGRTQGLPAIEHAYATMKLDEFKRAFLNIPTSAAEQVIPAVAWDLVCSDSVEPTAQVMGVDVTPERSAGGIVVGGTGPVIEVIDYRAGVGWLTPRVVELWEKYRAPVAVHKSGPAGSFIPEWERAGVQVLPLNDQEFAASCGRFYDLVVDRGIQIRRDADLDAAVSVADKRPVGDGAWAWGRKASSGDVCLLVAATVAAYRVEAAVPVDVAANVW